MSRSAFVSVLVVVSALAVGCGEARGLSVHGRVTLTVLHTADTHSELFSYRERIGWADARRGLGAEGAVVTVGGFARLASLVGRERARSERTLVIDSGDAFQGSLTFDAWGGEAELLALGALGVQAQALGNHELDRGGENLRERYRELATFRLLAANYVGDASDGISAVLEPWVVLEASGLRVGVVGVGNVRSVPELRERPNELGVLARDAAGAAQGAVDVLRPVVDVVVVVTHLGLDADRALVRETSGVDLVLGGHQHIALDEPLWESDCEDGWVRDAWGRARRCVPRRVPIVHSGAYTRYLGRLDLTLDDEPSRLEPAYDPLDAHEITAAHFELLPVNAGVPEDLRMTSLLERFRPSAPDALALADLAGFAPSFVPRVGATGGDSALGNFAASAVLWAAGADFAVIGSSSMRRDLVAGPLDEASLERSFPFDDPVLSVRLTGRALGRAFEAVAASAAGRDCRSPVQIAGGLARMTCPCDTPRCAELFVGRTALCCRRDDDCSALHGACSAGAGDTGYCYLPVIESESYSVATTGYLADGGSGLLEPIPAADRTPVAAGLREAVSDALHQSAPCDETRECDASSERLRRICAALPCLDERAGAVRDGRIRMQGP